MSNDTLIKVETLKKLLELRSEHKGSDNEEYTIIREELLKI